MVAPAHEVLEMEAIAAAELTCRLERVTQDSQALPAGSLREQLIAQICRMNPGAGRALLAQFTERALQNYLDHLKLTLLPRGTRWVRIAESPAITSFRQDDLDSED